MANILKLFCNNESLNRLSTYAEFYKIRFDSEFTIDKFFEYNRALIFDQLSEERKQTLAKEKSKTVLNLTAEDITKDIELPVPCYLCIDEKYINYSLIAKNTNLQAQETNVLAFEDKSIKKILNTQYTTLGKTDIKRLQPGCRVMGWFKAHYFDKKYGKDGAQRSNDIDNIYDSTQDFIDLSPFIISLNTSVNEGGGNFSLTLPHIPFYAPEETASADGNISMGNAYRNGINKIYDSENNLDKITLKIGDVTQIVSRAAIGAFNYFEWLISANDLLFISFDNMSDEKKIKEEIIEKPLTDGNLSDHQWDMIALIDSISVSRNANGQVHVDVSGRDLMKLITDDASIFFPAGVTSKNRESLFGNSETVVKGGDLSSVFRYSGEERQNGAMRQLTGQINIFACEPNDFSIDFVIKTVISHLANMQIVPDDLFQNWGDKRTKFSALRPKNQE